MTIYCKNGRKYYPTKQNLKRDFPNVSFPSIPSISALSAHGIFSVTETAKPVGDVVTEADPILVGNEWVQQWDVRAFTPEEQQAHDDANQDIADKEEVRLLPSVRNLILATPTQIDNYIENNVTNLATAKDVLKILAKAISVIGRHEFRQ